MRKTKTTNYMEHLSYDEALKKYKVPPCSIGALQTLIHIRTIRTFEKTAAIGHCFAHEIEVIWNNESEIFTIKAKLSWD